MAEYSTEQVSESQVRAQAPREQVPDRPGESELFEWVSALRDEAEKGRKDQGNADKWTDWVNGFWGDQWPDAMPTFKPPIVLNALKSYILQEVSDLTDSRIRIFVMKDPKHPDRDEMAERAIQAYWQRAFVDMQVTMSAIDASILPCGFLSCLYDPYLASGQGEIVTEYRDPFYTYPDPTAKDDDHWRYLIFEDIMDVLDIRRLWPVTGYNVQPDAQYSVRSGDSKIRPMTGERYSGPLYQHSTFGQMVEGYKKAQAAVLTCFVYDDALEEEVTELEGQPIKVSVRKRYPNGRLIQVANGKVLYDGLNPYRGRFPCIRLSLTPSPHRMWPPISMVGEFLEVQRASNKADSMVVENAMRLNSGQVFADADSGIDPENYANIPGQVNLIKPASKVDIKYPPPMPGDMIQLGDRLRGQMAGVMGFTQSRVGAGQRGNVSAELTESEISQSMGLTRLRARLMQQSVQKLVEMIFQRMAQCYTVPRHIPYIHDDKWSPVPWVPIADSSAYAVHVDPASFQVKSKTMMQRLYLLLARLGKMPTEDLLTMLDVPDAKTIAAKMKQELMLMAAAKQMQKGKKL